ncbi:MAG: YhfC family intramembrane metalloprotease [Butyrivibrio sp.]|nr:YhfC family intramembrane metalloprotease [Butyrivibrio sp.]
MMNINNLAIAVTLLFSLALPLGLVIWWKKKTGAGLWPFIAGAICFTVFAMGLEQILHTFCLVQDNSVSNFIVNHTIAYMLYGSFAAGIFEETARLFGFNVLLKKYKDKKDAIAYGIGHGGIEVIFIIGLAYFFIFLAICGVTVGDEATTQTLLTTAETVKVSTCCMGMLERISAMLTHVGLSMIVFVAAREKGKFWLYPIAILLHAVLDAPAALFQIGVPIPMWVLEAEMLVMSVVVFMIGKKILKDHKVENG